MERQRAEMLIKIARVRLECGRTGDALNYLYQAQSLYPTRTAAALIQAIRGGYLEADGAYFQPTHDDYEEGECWGNHNHCAGCGNCGRPAWREDDDDDEEEEEEQQEEEEEERVTQGFQDSEDYYSVLGVRRNSSEEMIRKSYRKLALRYHPDKNSSPGATEAFKVIGKAFAVLSDPAKRKQYDDSQGRTHAATDPDLTTDELFDLFFRGHFPARAAYAGHPREQRPTRRDEAGRRQRWSSDEDTQDRPRWQREGMGQDNSQERRWRDEVYNEERRQWQWEREQKQDGGPPKCQKEAKREAGRPKTQQERREDAGRSSPKWWNKKGQETKKSRWREEMEKNNIRRPRRQEEEEGGRPKTAYSAFIQVLPVLILVVVSVVAQMTANSPPYSLHPRPSFGLTISRETSSRGVPYYVGHNFQARYRGQALVELERAVEKEYAEQVQAGCWKEKQQRSDLANLARLYGDERLREKADTFKMENCRKLSDLIGLRRGG